MRLSHNLPLRVVAAAADMDQAHLSKVELGQRYLTEKQGEMIAIFFNISPIEFEARRIAEKFIIDNSNESAKKRAIELLYVNFFKE